MPQKGQTKEVNPIQNWPESQRPRERLFRDGVRSLSDAELLSVFLRCGTRGENVHDLSLRLLKTFGGLNGLAHRPVRELLGIGGLGPAKVAALLASFEIGNRLRLEKIERKPVISSSEGLFDFLHHSIGHEREELFLGVLLNAKNELMTVITFSRGGPSQVVFSIPAIIRKIVVESAAAVIFAHNHPSGDPRPSPEDTALTKQLKKACDAVGVVMHDHVIIAGLGANRGQDGSAASDHRDRFFSFLQSGRLR